MSWLADNWDILARWLGAVLTVAAISGFMGWYMGRKVYIVEIPDASDETTPTIHIAPAPPHVVEDAPRPTALKAYDLAVREHMARLISSG